MLACFSGDKLYGGAFLLILFPFRSLIVLKSHEERPKLCMVFSFLYFFIYLFVSLFPKYIL